MSHHEPLSRGLAAIALAAALSACGVARASTPADSSKTIKGGADGKTFESITVEGEDKVRVEFARPTLQVAIDPATAPGLEWDNFRAILDPAYLDVIAPFFARSAFDRSPYRARAWLDDFREGDVARFRPDLEGVDRWSLTVADSRSRTVASFSGRGKPPKEIAWDGRGPGGGVAPAGLTYSYVLEAVDEAGNKRSFPGQGFELPPYARADEAGRTLTLVFALAELDGAAPSGGPAPIVLEAATRINQTDATRPVVVQVSAAAFPEARAAADRVVADLRALVLGDPARITATTAVEPGTNGGVTIVVGGSR
jgi:hypothetical protein